MTKNNETFDWKWRDSTHLEAHSAEFIRPVEDLLEEIRPLAAAVRGAAGTLLHEEWKLSRVCGTSGLREVDPQGSESFWAYRSGRSIPSHLCLGKRLPTHWICLWGQWEEDAFVIHTFYPGRRAPREIHDHEMTLDQLPESIEFWRRHAIVTTEGSYNRVIEVS